MIAGWFLVMTAATGSAPEPGPAMDSNLESQWEQAMQDEQQAVRLSAHKEGEMVEIIVSGQSTDPMEVSYDLAVAGASSTRHKGSTRLESGSEKVLSRVRIPQHDKWCATLDVTQGDGTSYRLEQGGC